MSAICDDITGSVHAITGYEHATTGYVHAITGNVTAITGYDSAILGSDHTHLFRQVDRLRFLFESFPTGLSRKARELATIVALQQHRWADEGEDFDARSRNCHWPLALRTRERGEGYPPLRLPSINGSVHAITGSVRAITRYVQTTTGYVHAITGYVHDTTGYVRATTGYMYAAFSPSVACSGRV